MDMDALHIHMHIMYTLTYSFRSQLKFSVCALDIFHNRTIGHTLMIKGCGRGVLCSDIQHSHCDWKAYSK